jgi:hypothetical protein
MLNEPGCLNCILKEENSMTDPYCVRKITSPAETFSLNTVIVDVCPEYALVISVTEIVPTRALLVIVGDPVEYCTITSVIGLTYASDVTTVAETELATISSVSI